MADGDMLEIETVANEENGSQNAGQGSQTDKFFQEIISGDESDYDIGY